MCNRLQRGPHSRMLAAAAAAGRTEARRATSCNPSRWMYVGLRTDDTKPHNSPNNGPISKSYYGKVVHPRTEVHSLRRGQVKKSWLISVGSGSRKCFKSSSKMHRRSFIGVVGCDMCAHRTHTVTVTHTRNPESCERTFVDVHRWPSMTRAWRRCIPIRTDAIANLVETCEHARVGDGGCTGEDDN
jgi:hypothetical protein